LVVITVSATAVAAPDDEPYVPPPFTRFPEEQPDPPPRTRPPDEPAHPPPRTLSPAKPAHPSPPTRSPDEPAHPPPPTRAPVEPAHPPPPTRAPAKPAHPPPRTSSPHKPAHPPPPTRAPVEPAHPPPLHDDHDDDTSTVWPAVLHAFNGTTLDFLAGFNAPLELAAGIELVLPWRIRLGTSFGVLPRSAARAANTQLIEHGAYERSLGALVDASMERVLLWHAHLAVQPWKRHGFLATAGYGVAWIHGTATVPQVADAIGMMVPDNFPLGDSRFDLRSRLHLVDAELGWEWRWHRHWSLRINLGVAVTLDARTHVTLQPAIDDARLHDLASRVEAKLDHAYTTYVKTPLLSVFIGYQL
jgi:hypothetical protein